MNLATESVTRSGLEAKIGSEMSFGKAPGVEMSGGISTPRHVGGEWEATGGRGSREGKGDGGWLGQERLAEEIWLDGDLVAKGKGETVAKV